MAIGSPQWMYSSGSYEIDQSLKFDRERLPYLQFTPSTASTRKKWTFSFWVKPSMISSSDSNPAILAVSETNTRPSMSANLLAQASGNSFHIEQYNGSSYDYRIRCTADLRDPSAWYHIMVAFDTTQSTASNRLKTYINGEQITAFDLSVYPNQDHQTAVLNTVRHRIGNTSWTDDPSLGNQVSGYLAEVNMIDGQQLTPSDFGETGTYGEWKPKEYSGTYGTNGFYLPFKNDYTVEGFSTTLFKGVSGESRYVGGSGFRPSLTWLKSRTNDYSHSVIDAVRSSDKTLYTNATNAEDSNGYITGFKPDGFQYSSGFAGAQNYVAWQWDMGANTPTGFGCVKWTGNATARSIGNVGFSPDLIIERNRDDTTFNLVYDKIRGAGKALRTNASNAESGYASDEITAFEPDGFRVSTGGDVNGNTQECIAWCWDMGGTTATNTTGSITSTVMANPTYGQSIVSWTGTGANATIGHGLSSAPDLVMYKNRDDAGTSGSTNGNWIVQSSAIGADDFLVLNDNSPEATDSGYFNGTRPSSSVLTVGAYNSNNGSSDDMIAYCFHSVSGYSKISSYTGNGSSTGPSVNLGFRPAFVMIKVADRTDGGNGAWWVFDSTRSFGTAIADVFLWNTTGAELHNNSNLAIDFLDNGFQLKSSYDEINVNGGTYVYMAFAGGVDSVSDFNTTGTIESRVKASTTYGQSIVSYVGNQTSGATVGHGLSSAPEMMIIKNRDLSSDWIMYHTSLGNTKHLRMNLTNGEYTSATRWNNTTPSSTVFTLGSDSSVNGDVANQNLIAYCFHSVTGYSKFGSYTGNGNLAGPSVTLGFKPAFVLIRKTAAADWLIFDNTRNPTNEVRSFLEPNTSDAETIEQTGNYELGIDFDSNGFQIKARGGGMNSNGSTYIYAAFADKREYAYWLDQSGNNNDWTSNNLTESDISVDSPTNNFATFNPLQAGDAGSVVGTISEGNLKHYLSGSGQALTMGTIAPTTGKWYCEFTMGDPSGVGSDRSAVGIGDVYDVDIQGAGNADKTVMVSTSTANRVWLTDNVESDNNFPVRTKGSIIQFAWDMDNSKVWIGIDNKWCNSSGAVIPKSDVEAGNNATVTDTGLTSVSPLNRWSAGLSITQTHYLNCGQDSSFSGYKTAQGNQDSNGIGDFYYEPPNNFLALCTDNLSTPAVKPQEHFDVVTYTGTGSNQAVAVNFQPDFSWIKIRSDADGSVLSDAVRGATKFLQSTYDSAEADNSAFVSAFTSTGLTLGGNRGTSESGKTYVAWNWKANGSGSSNSNGSITSTVSANTDAGFSIIKYHGNATAGATIGHGLSKAPELVICKDREAANGWGVGAFNENNTKALYLNSDGSFDTNNYWNSTNPSATVITLGISGATNANNEMICYAFHSVDGYSKVGSYTGTGNSDGTFVYTGHRPSFVLVKSSSRAESWGIYDSERLGYNPNNRSLYPNLANAEHSSTDHIDILSNGFKLYSTNHNGTGESYIFLSIAETPFKYSNGR